ncbi:uncharacterized protein LOC127865555 isoform X1 [Dreissena polymorpha]|uniref:Uncharacterized protein n=1 Tax=Dreissena polymorpha TaxID=45954 RepID=A0A9D4LL33_DREPO|nr:uncharacterized protein LOC127865555 isoform X1 [Dreissena polymorpha]KAH3860005.1 hypothetical protein DPMN_022897 [Dreissena polymorpha]
MRLLCGLVVFIIHVPNETHENVLLGKWNETSIECSSKSELTFTFISKTSNRSRNIAECDVMSKTCFMLDKALRHTYTIYYTGRGGILQIINPEETHGTYLCFETYRPEMFASTTIMSPLSFAGDNSGNDAMVTVTGKSIECSSNSELTFKFFNSKLKVTRTLAECDEMSKSCLMFGKDISSKYKLSYTGRGGILQITVLDDETTGTYICCETYDPSNSVRTDIMADYKNEFYNTIDVVREVLQNETDRSSGKSSTNNETIYSIAIPVCVVVVIILIGLIIYVPIHKRSQSQANQRVEFNRKAKENETFLVESSMDIRHSREREVRATTTKETYELESTTVEISTFADKVIEGVNTTSMSKEDEIKRGIE